MTNISFGRSHPPMSKMGCESKLTKITQNQTNNKNGVSSGRVHQKTDWQDAVLKDNILLATTKSFSQQFLAVTVIYWRGVLTRARFPHIYPKLGF